MNQELDKLFKWATANKLSINFGKNKTYYIVHTFRNLDLNDLVIEMDGNTLENSNEGMFLGVIIDRTLSYRSHIDHISSKISKSIGILFKLSNLKVPKSILAQVYYALIHSYLNYNICCYLGTSDANVNRLFLLQKRAVRIINGAGFLDHTDPLFYAKNILKIRDLYKLNVGLYMYERWDAGNYERNHSYNTRNRNDLLPRQTRLTVTHDNSLSCIGPNIWNNIPDNIRNATSLSSFKYQHKTHLVSSYDV